MKHHRAPTWAVLGIVCALPSLAGAAPPDPEPQAQPKVQRRAVVRTSRQLEIHLAAVEAEATRQRPASAPQIRNCTLLAQIFITERLVRTGQPFVLYPEAIAAYVVAQVDLGMDAKRLADAVLATMREDGFAALDAKLHKGRGSE